MSLPSCYFDTPVGRDLEARRHLYIIHVKEPMREDHANEMRRRFKYAVRAHGVEAFVLDNGATIEIIK